MKRTRLLIILFITAILLTLFALPALGVMARGYECPTSGDTQAYPAPLEYKVFIPYAAGPPSCPKLDK